MDVSFCSTIRFLSSSELSSREIVSALKCLVFSCEQLSQVNRSDVSSRIISLLRQSWRTQSVSSGKFTVLTNLASQRYSNSPLLDIFKLLPVWFDTLHSVCELDSDGTTDTIIQSGHLELVRVVGLDCIDILGDVAKQEKFTDASLKILGLVLHLTFKCCMVDRKLNEASVTAAQQVGLVLKKSLSEEKLIPIQFHLAHLYLGVYGDSSEVATSLCAELLSKNISPDCETSASVVYFLVQNLPFLCQDTKLLQDNFPNILRIAASFPDKFGEDFMHILPAVMSEETSEEILHYLIDLPCVKAVSVALQQTAASTTHNVNTTQLNEAAEFYLRKQPMKESLYRTDKLKMWHDCLLEFSSYRDVINNSKLAVLLLNLYATTLTDHLTELHTERLTDIIRVAISRASLIYDVPGYRTRVNSVMSRLVERIFYHSSSLVSEMNTSLLTFLTDVSNARQCCQVYTSVLWGVGMYTSMTNRNDAMPHIVRNFEETLEAVLYELLCDLNDFQDDSQKWTLLAVLCTTLAKLAGQRYELIPRVVVCLTKLRQQLISIPGNRTYNVETALNQLHQLMALLKSPLNLRTVLCPGGSLTDERAPQRVKEAILLKLVSNMAISEK